MRRPRVSDVFVGGISVALLAGVGLALIGESLIKILEVHGPLALAAGGVVALTGATVTLYSWPWRREIPSWMNITGHPAAPARVVVVTASRGRGSGSVATIARHHRATLERLYVLYTDDYTGRQALTDVRAALTAEGVAEDLLRPRKVPAEAADDPRPAYLELERCVEEAEASGFGPLDIVFDYTGGTKAFTAAMTLAGATEHRRLEYVAPAERDRDGRPSPGAAMNVIEVDLDFRVKPGAGIRRA